MEIHETTSNQIIPVEKSRIKQSYQIKAMDENDKWDKIKYFVTKLKFLTLLANIIPWISEFQNLCTSTIYFPRYLVQGPF